MSATRDALARLVAALDAWEDNCLRPKVDLDLSEQLDEELCEALAAAKAHLSEHPEQRSTA